MRYWTFLARQASRPLPALTLAITFALAAPARAAEDVPSLVGAPDPVVAAITPAPPIAPAPPGILPAFIYGNGVFDSDRPDIVMTARGGVRFSPAYFGSTKIASGPDVGFRLDRLVLPGGFRIGSNDTVGFLHGFTPRVAARYIRGRHSDEHSEIDGLDDVPFSLELGFGVGYERRSYRAFADLRYGLIGHNTWAGDLGADGISYPYEGLTLTLGPRVSFGSQRFMNTYFGISPEDSEASGLASFAPEAGIYGAGMELGARYLFNERWGIEGAARWTRLLNSAADSPVVTGGADDQYMVRFDLSRRISLDF